MTEGNNSVGRNDLRIGVGLGKNWKRGLKKGSETAPQLSEASKMTARAVGELYITGAVDRIILSTGPTKTPQGMQISESRAMAYAMLAHFQSVPNVNPREQTWFQWVPHAEQIRIEKNYERRQTLIAELSSLAKSPDQHVSKNGLITLEEKSFDTVGNAAMVSWLAQDCNVVLVSVGYHLFRASRHFRRSNVHIVEALSSQGIVQKRGVEILGETNNFGYASTPEDREIAQFNSSLSNIGGHLFELLANTIITLDRQGKLLRLVTRRTR